MASIEVEFDNLRLTRDGAYEPGKTSLLLVDMQRIWCEPNLDPTHPQDADSYYHRRAQSEAHSGCRPRGRLQCAAHHHPEPDQ
jgi:hypothetical protein